MDDQTQEICDKLLGNDSSFVELDLDVTHMNDDAICAIFSAMKHNTTINTVYINSDLFTEDGEDLAPDQLVGSASMFLAEALSKHPSITCLWLYGFFCIQCFSAITLAIQQNENLSSLCLVSCGLTASQMSNLEWLLSSNTIEYLHVSGCFPRDGILRIPKGLHGNRSLKRLTIKNVRLHPGREQWSVSLETLQAIPEFLRENQVLASLTIARNEIPPETLSCILEAMKWHKALSKLSFESIGAGVANAGNVFASMLASNRVLTTLNLSNCSLGDNFAMELADVLYSNTGLEVLDLGQNEISSNGATALADAIRVNTSLKGIILHGNPIGDDGIASLAHALRCNTGLTTLKISGKVGLSVLALHLPLIHGLKNLDVYDLNALTSQCTGTFLEALERNTELETVDLQVADNTANEGLVDEIMPKVRHQLALNRGGKRILKYEGHVPSSLWPRILARSSNNLDVIYHFLREKPDVLINKPPVSRGLFGLLPSWTCVCLVAGLVCCGSFLHVCLAVGSV